MSVKKYLYREEEEVFIKIEEVKKLHASEKFTTKDAITYLINKGYTAEMLSNTVEPTSLQVTSVAIPGPSGTTISEVK